MSRIELKTKDKTQARDFLRTAYNLDPTTQYQNNMNTVAGENIRVDYNTYTKKLVITSGHYTEDELKHYFRHCF